MYSWAASNRSSAKMHIIHLFLISCLHVFQMNREKKHIKIEIVDTNAYMKYFSINMIFYSTCIFNDARSVSLFPYNWSQLTVAVNY